ncbi:ABC transporter ATP-binding protein [Taylorella asinigenitalis 14/45]|uniref:ABC transporter ATP-binding protein n=1 Tax=Taylorella asinigenitalis 14/45 TaxID=1091495 RepID=I7J0R5_9BURK|nr:ABC transporter ATP-binding protein [Taylorella asinigenitalis]CCG19086.1 ABC transporter ATP-binding protein [Taylorella asinigenitalis 14/45]
MKNLNNPQNLLEVRNLKLGYEVDNKFKTIVSDLNFDLKEGEIACLLGPSGGGKTTVLRSIAGFEPVYEGSINVGGKCFSRKGEMVPPERRQIGMMFQDYALFPHLDIKKNVSFGLYKLPKSESKEITKDMLNLVGLSEYKDNYPHELSGGQQQRVALARALAPNPKLLLLDEPFSNLDVDTREKLALDVRKILKDQGMSAILVTHNQVEAFAFADKIGIINDGKLVQWGTPESFLQSTDEKIKSYIRKDVAQAYDR